MNTESNTSSGLKRWGLLIFLCLLIVVVLAGLKYRQISKAIAFAESYPESSEAVTTVIASPEDWPQTYRTIAEVKSTQQLELRNEVSGIINTIGFQGGETVSVGQLLLSLDDSEEQAQLAASQAQLKLANLQLRRLAELRKKKLASKNDYDSAEADRDVLIANITALRARIKKKNIEAPFAAQTSLHDLQPGQYLEPNSLISSLIGVSSERWLDFHVPQQYARLKVGESIVVRGKALAEGKLTAQIIAADASLNTHSRNRRYRASFSSAGNMISPGSVLDIDVQVGLHSGVFKLPIAAVRYNALGSYVYVLEQAEADAGADYRAQRRVVIVGERVGEDIIVLSGINDAERIAAIGSFKLSEGMLTHVVDRVQDGENVTDSIPSNKATNND